MKIPEIATYKTSLKIAGIYALAGCLWILFSDRVLESLVTDYSGLSHLQTYKGWFYVIMTALLVFLLINKHLREIKVSREALQERETRYRNLFEDSPISLWECDLSGIKLEIDKIIEDGVTDLQQYFADDPREVTRIIAGASIRDVNTASVALFQAKDKEQLIAEFPVLYTPQTSYPLGSAFAELANGARVVETELPARSLTGTKIHAVVNLTVAPGCETDWSRVLVSMVDESYRKQVQLEHAKLESQLRQAQRMESMGVLAGGIAHDFNNILTPLCGYANIAYEELPADSPVREDLQQVVQAADRAKELINQILTFSRNSEQERQPVDMTSTVREALKLLRSTLPASIEIRHNVEENSGTVFADPSQIHQILMNLFTNAYQAMQDTGGVLDVTLQSICHDSNSLDEETEISDYIELVVSDTGLGMDASLQERIFEPFFTTKGVGKGTGLGLSVVHGVVRSYGGDITVTSVPNEGSTFRVRLPRSETTVAERQIAENTAPRGTEKIIFVDDDPQVSSVVSRMLASLGYNVRTFTSSLEALDLLRTGAESCDLLITDYTMPHLSGKELAVEVTSLLPNLPILLISGIHVDVSYEQSRGVRIVEIIMKPIGKVKLGRAVRRALDSKAPAPTSSPFMA
jgi:signal transduction histidine kinase/ActR/RegA family two-component response regulator